MDNNTLDQILEDIILNSKYKDISNEQKNTLKKKLIQKYSNDLNYTALQMLDSEKQKKFSEILASQNQSEIDLYIAENIPDLKKLTDITNEKYVNEVSIFLE